MFTSEKKLITDLGIPPESLISDVFGFNSSHIMIEYTKITADKVGISKSFGYSMLEVS